MCVCAWQHWACVECSDHLAEPLTIPRAREWGGEEEREGEIEDSERGRGWEGGGEGTTI